VVGVFANLITFLTVDRKHAKVLSETTDTEPDISLKKAPPEVI